MGRARPDRHARSPSRSGIRVERGHLHRDTRRRRRRVHLGRLHGQHESGQRFPGGHPLHSPESASGRVRQRLSRGRGDPRTRGERDGGLLGTGRRRSGGVFGRRETGGELPPASARDGVRPSLRTPHPFPRRGRRAGRGRGRARGVDRAEARDPGDPLRRGGGRHRPGHPDRPPGGRESCTSSTSAPGWGWTCSGWPVAPVSTSRARRLLNTSP